MSRLSRSFSLDGYNNYQSGGGPWSQSGGRHVGARPDGSGSRGAPYAWPQNSYSGYMGGGGSDSVGGNGGSTSNPEMQILMSQVRQLQQKVIELTNSRPSMNDERPGAWPPGDEPMSSGGYSGNHPSNHPGNHPGNHPSNHSGNQTAGGKPKTPLPANGQRRILLVSNLPPTLATCDSVYFMFERFGTVERVKILRNQRTTALVQMSTPSEAEKAVEEQEVLTKTARDIFVNFSTNVNSVRMPSEVGLNNDGLTRDYTGAEPYTPDMSLRDGGGGGGGMMYGGDSLLGAPPIMGHYGDRNMMQDQGGNGSSNGPCLLVSSLPEELANPDSLCNLFGFYGDVVRVKILRNKRDCALVQLSKPHQATLCRNFLDQAKVCGKKICVSFSRMSSIKLPSDIGIEDDSSTKDYSNVRGVHRFRNPNVAQKLMKNLCAPTSVLHVANLSEEFDKETLKAYFLDHGFTVKEVHDCGKDGTMALVQLCSVEESIAALAKLHNKPHPEIKSKNNAGLCFSFSNRRLNND